MNKKDQIQTRESRLRALSETGADTDMGKLLRTFWQPVAVAKDVEPGKAKAIRIMGEDLTLYRGESGKAYVVGGRCAHRLTLLHTGWVDGEKIRCMYHGWQYDGTGQCTERPAENDKGLPDVKIRSYPTQEYAELIFAYMGEGEPPEFNLPRKPIFEDPGYMVMAKSQIWPCNWFQQIENSMDAVHVSFVHRWGRIGAFGQVVSDKMPKLEYAETEAGIRQTATRGEGNVRISDWTFPNNNHIVVPNKTPDSPWLENGVWMVPVDDEQTIRFQVRAIQSKGPEEDQKFADYFNAHKGYNPTHFHDELFHEQKMPEDNVFELTPAQDYVAQIGQGAIVDRTQEYLGESDTGIVFMRKIFWREMDAMRSGKSTKEWCHLEKAIDLPKQGVAK